MDARVPQPKHVCRCTVQGRGSRARRAAARDCQSRLCVCMRESPPSAVRAPVRARHAHTRAAQSARGSGCRLRRGYHLECQWSFAERSGRSARQAVSEFRGDRRAFLFFKSITIYSTSHGGHEDKNCAFDLQVLCNHHGVGSLVLRVVLVWPSSSVARPNRGAHAAQGRDLDLRERRHGPDRPPKHRTASARRRVDRWAST